ncbi:MAG: hypothetical protein MUC67_06935 [Acidobacteria bacterium]|jgi:type II secretory pathway pseudopilin PulG|nr:hypothetical protein [Acidobacteriota bacterium]
MSARRRARGHSLLGALLALALSGFLAALLAVQLRPAAQQRAVEAAAHAVAARMRTLGLAAARDGRARAVVFAADGSGEPLCEAVDGDADGVRRRDVTDGRDPTGAGYRLARDFPGVELGRPRWPRIRELPPARGTIGAAEPAVRFGTARMAVFDPSGHATSGSLFVTDGTDALCAVVVYGVTSRVQVWCYQRTRSAWTRR